MKKFKNIICLLLVVALVTGCGCHKKDKKQEKKKENKNYVVNTEKEVIKDREVDGLEMTNTSLTTENGLTKFYTTVTNNTDKDYELKEYIIILKDEKGKEITTINGYVGDTIKKGESRLVDISTNADVTGTKSIEYKVLK